MTNMALPKTATADLDEKEYIHRICITLRLLTGEVNVNRIVTVPPGSRWDVLGVKLALCPRS